MNYWEWQQILTANDKFNCHKVWLMPIISSEQMMTKFESVSGQKDIREKRKESRGGRGIGIGIC